MSTFERRLYGHRGACAHLPENTIPSFERALRDGANALELDVHVTVDAQVVVSHDPDGSRRAGTGRRIAECTLAEVKQWQVGTSPAGTPSRIPTLDEVLTCFPEARLNVDIKPADTAAVQPVLEIIGRHDAAARVTLASFHDQILAAVHDRHYRGDIGLGPRDVVRLLFTPGWLLRWFPPEGTAVQVPPAQGRIPLDSSRFIGKCHSLGLRVDYWVINDPVQAKRLLDAGADGIVTDDPSMIAPVMALGVAG